MNNPGQRILVIPMFRPRSCLKLVCAAVLVVVLATAPAGGAEGPWHEDFEGQTPSWKEAGGDAQGAIDRRERVLQGAYAGRRCEWLRVTGRGGTSVYVSHDVGRPRVIAELQGSVWVKADRPGIQIFARAVLPRTNDPRSGAPVMVRLEGTSYTQTGRWQQLRIENLPGLLARRVRGLRMQMGPQVDGREAYVDQIHLNVYGGPGVTNVWIDELNLVGYADSAPAVPRPSVVPLERLPDADRSGQSPTADRPEPTARDVSPGTSAGGSFVRPRRIKLSGSVLEVDGRRVLPRAIGYQGESLARLAQLGFNTVRLSAPPSPVMLREAGRLELMLICPPPAGLLSGLQRDPMAPAPKIGPEYEPVLAWDLGSHLSEQQVEPMRRLAGRIRAADGYRGRPLICRPDASLREYSGFVDLLTVGQSPLATSLELSDYGRWIRHRSHLARPGTTIWSTVQSEPSWALRQQWASGGRRASLPPEIGVEQIRLMAYTAIAAGSRGLLFDSSTSLEATDPASRGRAAALELVNLELELARRWVAAGRLVETVASRSHPEVSGAVFEYHRTHLLVPLWTAPGAQYVPGQAAGKELTFVVRGVPNSNRAYEITPGGLRPVGRRQRVTGGIEVTLGEFSLCSMILFAEDRKIVASVREEAKAIGPRAARLYRQLAARKLEIVEDVDRRLSGRGAGQWQPGEHLVEARKYLQSSDGAAAARDYTAACLNAERAMRLLRLVERSNWATAVGSLRSPVASPATVCFSTLPWHWSLVDQTRSWRLGPNLVSAGDFESIASVTAAGWGHFQHRRGDSAAKHAMPNIEAAGEIVARAAHQGRAGLRLVARLVPPEQGPILIETPPVWVTSPPVSVEAGALVHIQGWVHIPTPLTGSVDGLCVFDSMTGEALAERIGETTGWQPLCLYRIAPQSGPMSVTFALSGLGEVWIDDVAIGVLAPAAAPLGQHQTTPARRF